MEMRKRRRSLHQISFSQCNTLVYLNSCHPLPTVDVLDFNECSDVQSNFQKLFLSLAQAALRFTKVDDTTTYESLVQRDIDVDLSVYH